MKFRDRAHFEEELLKTLEKVKTTSKKESAKETAERIYRHSSTQGGFKEAWKEYPNHDDMGHPDHDNAVDHIHEAAEKHFGELHEDVAEHLRENIRDGLT